MDGNNRWSKKNKTNKYNGYKKGANTIIKLSNYIFHNTDAKYVSAFALSKNNLNRSIDKDNLYILGSNNVKQKIIGDQINSNDLRKKYIEKIDLRLLEINKNIFYKILNDINIEISNKNNSSMLPLPSAINLGGLKNEEIYIKGDGPFEEGLACLKMICKIFKVN